MASALVPISAYGGGVIVLPWEGVVFSAHGARSERHADEQRHLRGIRRRRDAPRHRQGDHQAVRARRPSVAWAACGATSRVSRSSRIPPTSRRRSRPGAVPPARGSRSGPPADPRAVLPGAARPGPAGEPRGQHLDRVLRVRPVPLAPRGRSEARDRDVLQLRRLGRRGEPDQVQLRHGDRRQRRGAGAPARHLRRRLGAHRVQRQLPSLAAPDPRPRPRPRGRGRDVLQRLAHAVAQREPRPPGDQPGLKKTLGSSGLRNVDTAVVGGVRMYIRF